VQSITLLSGELSELRGEEPISGCFVSGVVWIRRCWSVQRLDLASVKSVSSRSLRTKFTTQSSRPPYSNEGKLWLWPYRGAKVWTPSSLVLLVLLLFLIITFLPNPLDSTVLAHVLSKLNSKYDYGLKLYLLSIDEGIKGYRDDSLEVVSLAPLVVLSFSFLPDDRVLDCEKEPEAIRNPSEDRVVQGLVRLDHGRDRQGHRNQEQL